MLAENNETMGKAVSGVWQLTREEVIREQCRAREEWLINDKWKTDTIAKQADQIAKQEDQIAQQAEQINHQTDEIISLKKDVEALRQQLAQTK